MGVCYISSALLCVGLCFALLCRVYSVNSERLNIVLQTCRYRMCLPWAMTRYCVLDRARTHGLRCLRSILGEWMLYFSSSQKAMWPLGRLESLGTFLSPFLPSGFSWGNYSTTFLEPGLLTFLDRVFHTFHLCSWFLICFGLSAVVLAVPNLISNKGSTKKDQRNKVLLWARKLSNQKRVVGLAVVT